MPTQDELFQNFLNEIRGTKTPTATPTKTTGSVPLTGPIMPGTSRPSVPVSTPSSGSTATPSSGVLPGPYPQYGQDGSITSVKAGFNPNTDTISRPPTTATPMPVQQSFQAPDYAALAAARFAASLAQKRRIAEQQKGSLDRSFARDGQITNDNRTLENVYNDRTLDPFNGHTSFQKGITSRERTLVDETKSGNLAAQKSNIDQLLADYESATADEQVRIADELQRADRQYQIDLSNVTGTFNGQKTATQSNSDRNFNQNQQVIDYNQNPNNPSNYGQSLTNQLNELKLGNYPTEVKQQAQLFEQEFKTGKMTQETAEYNLKQLKDPNSPVNQAQKLDLQMKQLEAKNLPEKQRLELQQLKKQIAEIGVVHYKPQTATEIAMDQANLKILQGKVDALNNPTAADTKIDPKSSAEAYANYKDQIDNSTHTKAEKLAFAASVKDEMTASDYANLVKGIK